jgi:RNA methyltransferase, TrmH family
MPPMPTITSVQNPRVKDAVRLRDSRHREKQGRILIDGARELRRAIEAGVRLVEAFVCEPLCRGDEAGKVLKLLPTCGAEVWEVAPAVFERLAFGQREEGIVAVAEMPKPTLATLAAALDAAASKPPLVAVLEGVEKPGNVGAVLRSADAAGVSGVIVADGRTDLYNPNAIRASLGTIFTTPICEADGRSALDWWRDRGFTIAAARVDGAVPYTELDYRGPTAIVLGSEAAGLSAIWTGDGVRPVRLPMLGAADSLNVSVTAAVLFYEALRQRGETPRDPG